VSGAAAALAAIAALGSGLVAGTLFAFSTFVMSALSRLPPADAIRAMQAINAGILRSAFMPVFLGAAAAALAAAAAALFTPAPPAARFLACAAALLYLAGVIAVTLARNVPLNDALQAFAGGDPAEAWRQYLGPWMRWNHLRTAAATAALLALLGALRARG
jgi:uncharacterized membrane protein